MIPLSDDLLPCHGMHEIFDSTRKDEHEYAAALCRRCPIGIRCLEDAITETSTQGFDVHGTRGGMLFGAVDKPPTDACGDKKGTETGYNRHYRAKEKACEECYDKHMLAERRRRERLRQERGAA